MNKYNVYFLNVYDEERIIGQVSNETELFKLINDFLEEHHFKSYYTRSFYIREKDRMRFDVGSYTEFFEVDNDLYKEGENK